MTAFWVPKPGDLISINADHAGTAIIWSIDNWVSYTTDAAKLLLISSTGGIWWAWRFQRWAKVG